MLADRSSTFAFVGARDAQAAMPAHIGGGEAGDSRASLSMRAASSSPPITDPFSQQVIDRHVCILAPLSPLSGNLTTARRLCAMLDGYECVGPSPPPLHTSSRERDTDAGNGDGDGGSRRVSAVWRLRAHVCDAEPCARTNFITPTPSSAARFQPWRCPGGRPCDVVVVLHALRGGCCFTKHFGLLSSESSPTIEARNPHHDSRHHDSHAPPPYPPYVVVFGGTDVNESAKDAALAAVMGRVVAGARAVVCFSRELLAEAAVRFGPGSLDVRWSRPIVSTTLSMAGGPDTSLVAAPQQFPVLCDSDKDTQQWQRHEPAAVWVIPQSVVQPQLLQSSSPSPVSSPSLPTPATATIPPPPPHAQEAPLDALLEALDGCVPAGPSPLEGAAVLPSVAVLHIGGIRPVKGQAYALEAWRHAGAQRQEEEEGEEGGEETATTPSSPPPMTTTSSTPAACWLLFIGASQDVCASNLLLEHVDAVVDCGHSTALTASAERGFHATWVGGSSDYIPSGGGRGVFRTAWVRGGLPHGAVRAMLSPPRGRVVAVLNTSESEGQPQAVLEAMAAGSVPVVARDISGNRSVVPDSTVGYIGSSPSALGAILRTLCRHHYCEEAGATRETDEEVVRMDLAGSRRPQHQKIAADRRRRVAAASEKVARDHAPETEAAAYRSLIVSALLQPF